jgi:hypothetical protein
LDEEHGHGQVAHPPGLAAGEADLRRTLSHDR